MKRLKNYIVPVITLLGSSSLIYKSLHFAISNADYESKLNFPAPYPDSYFGTVWHYLFWPQRTSILFISAVIVLVLSAISLLSKKEGLYKKINIIIAVVAIVFILWVIFNSTFRVSGM